MADLVTHVAAAYLPARALVRDPRVRAIVYLGACLPDLLYKTGVYALGAPTWFCEPTHSPLGLVPICWAAALLFEEGWRRRAFGALWAGSLTHLLVDLGKDYMGSGVILWGFPFTMDRAELAWYAPETRSSSSPPPPPRWRSPSFWRAAVKARAGAPPRRPSGWPP